MDLRRSAASHHQAELGSDAHAELKRTPGFRQSKVFAKKVPNHYLSQLECPSFGPISAELGAVAAAASGPLLIAHVRVVENEGESSNK